MYILRVRCYLEKTCMLMPNRTLLPVGGPCPAASSTCFLASRTSHDLRHGRGGFGVNHSKAQAGHGIKYGKAAWEDTATRTGPEIR